MNKITFREIPKEKIEENQIPKNQVYKVSEPMSIPFVEDHATHKEQVELDYQLKDGQYGLYANEFRGQYTSKDGCKKADVLACVVDEKEKTVYTLIFDVKSNISAFSDDLKKDEAVITAVKEVRDFIEQIHDSMLHKDSFMIYLKDEGYKETVETAIVTKNFEKEKFIAVADYLENILDEKGTIQNIPELIKVKQRTLLLPYRGDIYKLRKFAERELLIGNLVYELNVYLLGKHSENTYGVKIRMSSGNGKVMECKKVIQ